MFELNEATREWMCVCVYLCMWVCGDADESQVLVARMLPSMGHGSGLV